MGNACRGVQPLTVQTEADVHSAVAGGKKGIAFGMGDMLTLIEKAQQNYDQKQAAKLEEKLRKSKLTLQDYYEQLQQLRGMGDLSQLAGMGSVLPSVEKMST